MTSKALCRKKEYNIKDEPFVVTNTIPVQAFCQLRTAVHFQPLTEPQAKQVLAHTTAVIAIRHGARYAGITRILFDYGTDAYLTDVIVHPDYQGQGIGGLLVKNALAYLQTHVQPGVRIACSLYANPGKEPFYAAYGFQPPAQRPIRTRDAAGTVLTPKRPTAEKL